MSSGTDSGSSHDGGVVVPGSDYRDPELDRLERERLWPRVWQMACREEDLAQVGDYVAYDIADDSIINSCGRDH